MITLEQAKLHQRIDSNDDDALIALLLSAAIQHCRQYLNRPLYADNAAQAAAVAAGETDGMVITDDIRAAMLLTFGFLYERREDVGRSDAAALPVNACWLLDKYRKTAGV